MYVCAPEYTHMHYMHARVHGPEEGIRFRDLELQAVLSYYVVLRNELELLQEQ